MNNYVYDEWGNITSQTEGIENPFKYAGEVYDAESGLYYLRSRYYDPAAGRFISEDSYEGALYNPQSLNLYAYCVNNPLRYVDPTGHLLEEDLIKYGDKQEDGTYNQTIVTRSLDTLGQAYGKATSDQQRQDIRDLANEVRRIASGIGGKEAIAIMNSQLENEGVNETEIIIAAGHPFGALAVKESKEISEIVVIQIYGSEKDGANNNAFKHAYWNALISDRAGVNTAKNFTDSHEYGALDNLNEDNRSNMEMDLFNNAVGRYQVTRLPGPPLQGSRNFRDNWLAELVLERVNSGGLLRVGGDGTIATDSGRP